MILKVFIIFCLILFGQTRKIAKCLTGYMTDVQSWVGEEGELVLETDYENAIDLSANTNPVSVLEQKVSIFESSNDHYIKYLSLARCRLTRIPTVFEFQDFNGRKLSSTLEYMTFYGNKFQDVSTSGELYDVQLNATNATEVSYGIEYYDTGVAVWALGLNDIIFPQLEELDLRSCSINTLTARLFTGMPQLKALYIGENKIYQINADAFNGLKKLIHLDLSRNNAQDGNGNSKSITLGSASVFRDLENLISLDLSFTKLMQRNVPALKNLSKKLRKLSLCHSGALSLDEDFFNETSLKILDISANQGILNTKNVLRGLEHSLQVLYANDVGINNFNIFHNFGLLEILKLSANEISVVNEEVAVSLISLQILDLNKNRLTTWFNPRFSLMPSLKLLTIRDNNINLISEQMLEDLSSIRYIALSGNFIVCNCHARELFNLAVKNEDMYQRKTLYSRIIRDKTDKNNKSSYHNGFDYFNEIIEKRKIVINDCTRNKKCDLDEELEVSGNFHLTDYDSKSYSCLRISDSKSVRFSEVPTCKRNPREINLENAIQDGYNYLLVLLVLPCILLSLVIGFVFRRNLKICFITMKNSTMLSMISQKGNVGDHKTVSKDIKGETKDDSIFHYDVFVSYCNEDRGWILDHLLPQLEADCSISACLHERDFQVGLSILENIVSCMDRSRSIMLIISRQFLLSQWCQFEMHLAQHRLLETRREDLTLVLLEEIPRHLRPTTLHYLMLTKTYIVWPKDDSQRPLFWRRIKKSIVSQKLKQTNNTIP